jgi:hypothetical protein
MSIVNILICSICKTYCDGEECFSCDELTGQKQDVELSKDKSLSDIKNRITSLDRSSIQIMLSSYGDCPAEIDTIKIDKNELLQLLESNDFITNGISSVSFNGVQRECIGLAMIPPISIGHYDVMIAGLMIFTEY